jgi:tripartite-type tricarboxylate transporter receptor subunit TctC
MRSRRQRTSHVVDTFVWSSRRYCAPFYALFAPKGTPKAIVDKLAEALNKGLSEETVQKRLADLGAEIAEPERRGPKALAELQRSEVNRLGPILKAATAK